LYNSTLFAHKLDRTYAVMKEVHPLRRQIYYVGVDQQW
jgi:hypothetical protein